VVHDHRAWHLHAPPRGYHWVRVNHDVVLAAIATGVVLEVLYNHFD
jgi:Ni/Co efflux regulator RcnB